MSTVPNPLSDIHYPETDGRPMAETDIHRDWMMCIIERLQRFFTGQRVYVSGNLLIYYLQGNPKRCVAPDVFVVKDCDPRRRRIFKIWEENRVPNFVLETTSASTQREDLETKMDLFSRLGVGEYFLYDPLGEWLSPALIGYRLVNGDYEPIPPEADGSMRSLELGLSFRLDEEGKLEITDLATGQVLNSGLEEAEYLREETTHLQEEADHLRDENQELKKRLAALEKKLREKQGEKE